MFRLRWKLGLCSSQTNALLVCLVSMTSLLAFASSEYSSCVFFYIFLCWRTIVPNQTQCNVQYLSSPRYNGDGREQKAWGSGSTSGPNHLEGRADQFANISQIFYSLKKKWGGEYKKKITVTSWKSKQNPSPLYNYISWQLEEAVVRLKSIIS